MFKLPLLFFLLSKPEEKWQALFGGYRNEQCFRQNFQQQIRKIEISMMNGLETFMSKELKGHEILQHHCISLHFTEKVFKLPKAQKLDHSY